MIAPEEIQKFLKKHDSSKTTKTVHLTEQQSEMLNDLAEQMNVSFEDCTMIMMHILLQELDRAAFDFLIQEQAARN